VSEGALLSIATLALMAASGLLFWINKGRK